MHPGGPFRRHHQKEQVGRFAVQRIEIHPCGLRPKESMSSSMPGILPWGMAMPSPMPVEPSRSRSTNTSISLFLSRDGCSFNQHIAELFHDRPFAAALKIGDDVLFS
jgi:hypothetical protein